jgi:hypothetical protein
MNNYKDILDRFVGKDLGSWRLSKPMLVEDKIFASNGHIACALPKEVYQGEANLQYIKNPLRIFDEQYTDILETPLEFNTKDLRITDENLLSIMHWREESCDCKDDWCDDCEGDGVIITPPEKSAEFLGSNFQYDYLTALFDVADFLNDSKFLVRSIAKPNGQVFTFKVKECDIAIMPLKGTYEKGSIKLGENNESK